MEFEGTAFIDIISPCVTFANHPGSPLNYDEVKEKKFQLQQLGYIGAEDEIEVDYAEGEVHVVTLHDGSKLSLKKIGDRDHDVGSRMSALQVLHGAREQNQFATGLFYYSDSRKSENLVNTQNLGEAPLAKLTESHLSLSQAQINQVMAEFV